MGRENIEPYQVRYLNIEEKEIKGHLDLRDFVNLEELDCSFKFFRYSEKITSLDLSNCPNLIKLDCQLKFPCWKEDAWQAEC